MTKTPIIAALVGALALGGALLMTASSAEAAETMPAGIAHKLDQQPAEYTASAAKQRRMMIIQRNMNHQRYGRGYGYGGRGAYGRGGGYGYRGGYRPRGTYRQQWGRTW